MRRLLVLGLAGSVVCGAAVWWQAAREPAIPHDRGPRSAPVLPSAGSNGVAEDPDPNEVAAGEGGKDPVSSPRGPSGPPVRLARFEDLAEAYSIEIVTGGEPFPVQTEYGPISGTAPSSRRLRSYEPILVKELGLYPRELVKRVGLRRVVLCEDLALNGRLRGGIPDYVHTTLYLDVARGAYNRLYLREHIHHELFHFIDWNDDWQLYSDEEWAELNPPSFSYGSGGINAQGDPEAGLLTDQYPGFLNRYSMAGVEEDKAEVFAHMIVSHVAVASQAKEDPIVCAKTMRMTKLLHDFCPQMDESFWLQFRKGGRAFCEPR
jgi:hypothetical protein